VLTGELDLCSAYDEKRLPAVFELLTVHVEECAICSAALGGYRRSALAIAGPELLAAGVAEPLTHLWSDLVARANLLLHRGTEALTALPPNGRTAAAVAVAATAVAGGAATVMPEAHEHDPAAKPEVSHRAPIVRSKPRVAAHPAPRPIPRARATVTARRAKPSAPQPVATPAATPAREPIGFETRPAAAPAAQARSASAGEQTKTPRQEFGFEQP
jgi:hypothetical protein